MGWSTWLDSIEHPRHYVFSFRNIVNPLFLKFLIHEVMRCHAYVGEMGLAPCLVNHHFFFATEKPALVPFCWVLIAALGSYWLVSIAAFDGFATFANDSANYVLLARKWSPYFPASYAEFHTWTVNAYPPGFAWLLAVTGASESMYFAHVLVVVCMALAVLVFARTVSNREGQAAAFLLILTYVTLPGTTTYSLGILAENFYLLLVFLVLYFHRRAEQQAERGVNDFLLALFLIIAMLTRTIAISLVAAILVTAVANGKQSAALRIRTVGICLLSIALWICWGRFDPQPGRSYLDDMVPILRRTFFDDENGSVDLWAVILANTQAFPHALSRYLSLKSYGSPEYLVSLGVLATILPCLVLRAVRLHLDALYLVFYLAILFVWPYTLNGRFLHPAVLLLLYQPVALVMGMAPGRGRRICCGVGILLSAVLLANSLHVQWDMHKARQVVELEDPRMAHSFELYDGLYDGNGINTARVFLQITDAIQEVPRFTEEQSVMAAVKPVFHALLSQRTTVDFNLLAGRSEMLCDFQRDQVAAVFVSRLTGGRNRLGMAAVEDLNGIASASISFKSNGAPFAMLVPLERQGLERQLGLLGIQGRCAS